MIQNVLEAARAKGWTVMSISLKEEAKHANFYFVAAKRDNAPIPDAPYMTITASVPDGTGKEREVSFFHGHYDLTVDRVHEEIHKHIGH